MSDGHAQNPNRLRSAIATGAIAFAVALLAAPAAQAVTRYAAPAGATTGECTTPASACTLERAATGLLGTTEVVVTPGTYDLATSISISPGIDLHGQAGGPKPLINSSAPSPAFQLINPSARLADVRVVKTGGYASAISMYSDDSVIERVEATTSLAGGFACMISVGTIRDSVCRATGSDGSGLGTNSSGGGAQAVTARNVTAVGSGTGDSSGIRYTADGPTIAVDAKNTIADGTGADVKAFALAGGVTIALRSSNYSTVDTNDAGTPGTVTSAGTNGNQTAAPQFVDAAAGDLHQRTGSPTINAGAAGADLGSADLDGQARSTGAAPDVGADEFLPNGARYAEPGGDGPEPCLQADPCALEAAIEGNAKDGDTITVGSGTYNVSGGTVLDLDEDAVLRGAPGQARPKINFTGVFYGLRLQGSADATTAVVRDLELSQTGGYWPLSLRNATGERILVRSSGLGACGTFQGSLLRDSTCVSTGGWPGAEGAVSVNAGVGGQPLEARLRNVTAVATGAGTYGIHVFIDDGAGTIDARNVIAQGNGGDVRADSTGDGTATIELRNSNFATATAATGDAVTAPGTPGNQTAEPQLVNVGSGDLHQQGTSPTIDAGAAGADLGATDLDGQDRAAGDVPDIGADEWVVSPPSGLAVTPASAADDNLPRVSGTAPAGSTVRLYGDAACAGAILATGAAGAFTAPGLPVSVPDNSTTSFRARAVDSFGHPSDCSAESVAYRELTPAAPKTAAAPVAKPKCKKAKKGKRKKRCKKPRRR